MRFIFITIFASFLALPALAQFRPNVPIFCNYDVSNLHKSLNKVVGVGQLQAGTNYNIAGSGNCYWGPPKTTGGGKAIVKTNQWHGLYLSHNKDRGPVWFAIYRFTFNGLPGDYYASDSWLPAKNWRRSIKPNLRSECHRRQIAEYGECLLPKSRRAVEGYPGRSFELHGRNHFVRIPPNWQELPKK